MIALIARYHRKSAPKPSTRGFAALSPDDQNVVRVLAAILRVAIGLDRSHDGRVGAIDVALARRPCRRHGHPAGSADLALERYDADQRKALLEDVLGLPITIRA